MAEEQNTGQGGLADRVFRHVKEVVLSGLRESPGPVRALVAISYVGAAFAALLALVYVMQGQGVLGLRALYGGLGIVGLALAASAIWACFCSRAADRSVLTSRQPTWTRLVPKVPMSGDTTADMLERLKAVRTRTLEAIQRDLGLTDVQLSQIRANVFIPDISKLGIWGVCSLHIPEGLHVGMDRPEELTIRFWPSQGLTGSVYTSQRAQPARFDSSDEGEDWHEKFGLTEDQRKKVHPDLRWILSFPLKVQDGDHQRTMGVLNVDGLVHELTDDQLRMLMGPIMDEVFKLTAILMRQPKQRVAIIVEDENG